MKRIFSLLPLLLMAACVAPEVPGESLMEGFDTGLARDLSVSGTPTTPTLVGLGVELDPHFLSQNVTRTQDGATAEDWDDYVVRRCTDMGIQNYRVMLLPHWWEPVNDNEDPAVMKDEAFTWESTEMKSLYAVLDLAQATDAEVTLVLWGCPISATSVDQGYLGRHFLCPPQRSGENWVTTPADVTEFAENFVAVTKHLIQDKGYTCVKRLTPFNEPDGNVSPISDYCEVVKALDERLRKEGLREKVGLALSDNIDNNRSFLVSTVSRLGELADLLVSHTYIFGYDTKNSDVMRWEAENVEVADRCGKPHFVGEFGSNQCVGATRQTDINEYRRGVLMTRHVVNFLNAGAAGASYWSLIDQYYGKGESYGQMQQLGLWRYVRAAYQTQDLAGARVDYEVRPQYHAYELLTRFVRRGSRVYPIDTKEDFVAATAVRSGDGEWTYIIANGSDKDVHYRLSNAAGDGMNPVQTYTYREKTGTSRRDAMTASSGTLQAAGGVFGVYVPGQSVTVLTQL